MRKTVLALTLAATLVAGCNGNTESLEQELADVRAERDALAAQIAAGDRHDKTKATIEAVTEMIADPTAYGTENEFLDKLMVHFAPGAVMDDAAFGAVETREAWRNTLFGDVDANIKTWHRWISDDGSNGGALWIWSGTNLVGEPFELIGISVTSYNDEGLVTYELVTYPYDHDYVRGAFLGT